MGISWPSDLSDSSKTVSYDYTQGKSLDNSAPVYTNIQKKSNGNYLITYAYIYAYNECGPKINIKAEASAVVTLKVSTDISVCPAGVHNGDIEHAQVLLTSGLSFISVTFAYHEWDKTFTSSEIGWDGTHPVAYMGKGSHALYGSSGDNHYLYMWDIDKTASYTCIKYCKVLGIKIPCGTKSCTYGFTSSGSLYDTTGSTYKFKGVVRVLASNVFTVSSSSLSSDEQKLLEFQGRFGEQVTNSGWSTIENSINTSLAALYIICSSCKSTVQSGLSVGESHFESEAPKSLATKSWWTNTDVI